MNGRTNTITGPTIDQLRRAFSGLRPVREDYALVPIQHGFNWEACAQGIEISPLYLVVFRSVRRQDADVEVLKAFDDRAYEDARQAPGFIFYYKGQLTPERDCLSFCLWRSQEEGRAASARAPHAAAAGIVSRMYESYNLERHVVAQEHGRLVIDPLAG
jgi:hypothetical protein